MGSSSILPARAIQFDVDRICRTSSLTWNQANGTPKTNGEFTLELRQSHKDKLARRNTAAGEAYYQHMGLGHGYALLAFAWPAAR
eukprot:6204188-Pleurochrysis_carterae.AAC.2